jgi:hypothetical protein
MICVYQLRDAIFAGENVENIKIFVLTLDWAAWQTFATDAQRTERELHNVVIEII